MASPAIPGQPIKLTIVLVISVHTSSNKRLVDPYNPNTGLLIHPGRIILTELPHPSGKGQPKWEVSMSDSELSRGDFIKVTTGIVGGMFGVAIGLPAVPTGTPVITP